MASEFNLRTCNLRALNSLTKYPSILTYHPMGERGQLRPEPYPLPADAPLFFTEKVDGTNVRLIFTPDGNCLLGSREELLWSLGDLIGDPAQGIVVGLREVIARLNEIRLSGGSADHSFFVLYGEFYGGKVTAASKQYSAEGRTGFRLFDAHVLGDAGLAWLDRSLEEIAQWREANRQAWLNPEALAELAQCFDVQQVPALSTGVATGAEMPTGVQETMDWLRGVLPTSRATLDETGGGKPEGVILRTADRSAIYKLRFEDYERSLRKK